MPTRDAGRGRYANLKLRGMDGASSLVSATQRQVGDIDYDESKHALAIVIPSHREPGTAVRTCEPDAETAPSQADSHVDRFDCSAWLSTPKLALVFAESLARKMRPLSFRSRQVDVENLTRGWFTFCASLPGAEALDLPDLTGSLIARFVYQFLGAKSEDGEYAIKSGSTRIHRLGVLRKVIEGLGDEAKARLPESFSIPVAPWRGAKLYTPTPPLEMDLASKIYACASERVAEVMAAVEAVWESAGEAQAADPNVSTRRLPARTLPLGAAYLRVIELSGGYLPERKVLRAEGGELFALTRVHGYSQLARALAPTPRDIVPFVYLLAFQTLLNQQPLLDLRLGDVAVSEVLGIPRVHIETVKHRANTVQRMNFAESTSPDSPFRTLTFLVKWTKNIRKFCDASIRNDLFIYAPRDKHGEQRVETFHEHGRGRSPNFEALNTVFCKTSGFPWTGLRSIRALGAELANLIFGDNPDVQRQLLGQKCRTTGEGHYTSPASQRRGEQRLALAMEERTRWINTGGAIEPRGANREDDHSAATPGFTCIDPFHSPLRGQHSGRLCQAYGDCPGCPLGVANVHSGYSLARLLQLRQRFIEARADMGDAAWSARWQIAFTRLDTFWLPQFTDAEVVSEAETLTLPPLPPLD